MMRTVEGEAASDGDQGDAWEQQALVDEAMVRADWPTLRHDTLRLDAERAARARAKHAVLGPPDHAPPPVAEVHELARWWNASRAPHASAGELLSWFGSWSTFTRAVGRERAYLAATGDATGGPALEGAATESAEAEVVVEHAL